MQTNAQGREYRIPQKANDFTVTTMERDEHDDWVTDQIAMEWLKGQYGEKPTKVPIMLLGDDIDTIFRYNLEQWTLTDLICKGDRETAIVKASGEEIKCPCELLESKKCKPHGVLNVMLPFAGRVGGVHRFTTTSWHSIENIIATLKQIQQMTGGVLMGIPLMMTVTPTKVYPKGNDKPSVVPVVGIHYEGDSMSLLEAAKTQTNARLASGINLKQLQDASVSSLDDTPEDVADYNTEFASQDQQQEHGTLEVDLPGDQAEPDFLPDQPADEFSRDGIVWKGDHIDKPWREVPFDYLTRLNDQADDATTADTQKLCQYAAEEIAARLNDKQASDEEVETETNGNQADSGGSLY